MKIFKISCSLVILSIFSIFLNSCNSETIYDYESNVTKDGGNSFSARVSKNSELMISLEEKLVTDESFINFAKSYFKSKILISEIEIRKKIDNNYKVEMVNDSINIETAAVQSSLAYLALFYDNNKDIDILTEEEIQIVTNNVMRRTLNNVTEKLSLNPNFTFQENSLESAVVGFQNDFNDLVSTLPPNVVDPITGTPIASTYGLTWDEVGKCAIGALGSFVGSHIKVVKGIYSLLSGGAVTYNLALAAIGVICPQIKAAAAITTFAFCLLGGYLF